MTKKREKQPYCGFIVEFEPERSIRMTEWLSVGYEVSDSFSSDDWVLRRKEIFLIFAPEISGGKKSLIGAVYVERMRGTGGIRKPKYRFTKSVLFDKAIERDQLVDDKVDLTNSISGPNGGIRLTLGLWTSLINILRTVRPEQAQALDDLIALVEINTPLIGGTNKLDRLAEQRDAVGLVLDMARLDRADIFKSVDASKEEQADDFLDLLTNYRQQERSLIEHDERWLQDLLNQVGKEMTFSTPGNSVKVQVRITDKEPLETALGVDLLIYHSLYNSLIFVQYKAMKKEGSDGWFYTPDAQLKLQLKAMAAARTAMRKRAKSAATLAAQRLNDEPFYFKLCERRKPDATDASLIAGMSMNSLHFEEFLTLPEAKDGPSGGIRAGYKNCHRFFNNTEFIALVKGGWIGTSAQSSEFMKEVVTASLSGKRALVYALIEVAEQSTSQLRGSRKRR